MDQRAVMVAEMTPWIRQLAQADTPEQADKAAVQVEWVISRRLADQTPPGLLYVLWAGLEDLFSNAMLTGVPAEGALAVARRFAQEWLDTPPQRFEEFLELAAQRDFIQEVRSLGYVFQPPDPRSEQPWLGRWESIRWSVEHVDVTHSPYAAAQRILHELAKEPSLWRAGDGDRLTHLLHDWDQHRDRRPQIDNALRTYIRSLRADDVPALNPH